MKRALDHRFQGIVGRMAVAIAALGLSATLACGASAEEFRTWSDATGKYKIKAKFVELSGGKVTLEREDGTQVAIPISKLGEADKTFLLEMKSDQKSPFEAVKPSTRDATRAARRRPTQPSEEKDESGGGEILTPDWSGAKQLLPSATRDKWSVSIAAPPQPGLGPKRPIALPPKGDFNVKGFAINPVARRAVVSYYWDRGGQSKTRLAVCDLEKGTMLADLSADGKMIALALADSGSRVLLRSDEFGKQDRLEIWRLSKSGIEKELRFSTQREGRRGGGRDIKWARYIGPEKFVTVGGGSTTVWEAATAKPLCTLAGQNVIGDCFAALSPDRKYLAVAVDKQVCLLDLAAEEVVATLSPPKELLRSSFAFTAKGSRLLCGSMDRLYAWDMATGALYSEIPLTGVAVSMGEDLICPSEDHVLVGGRRATLLDIESQVKLWSYHGHELAGMLGDTCWFVVSGRDAGALVPSLLPHPAAQEKVQKAMDAPDLFVVKPGTKVKINVAGIAEPAEREKIQGTLAQKLQSNGCQVDPSGSVELVALTETGKRRDQTFGSIGAPRFGPFGRPSNAKTYSVQEYFSRLRFVCQGQTVWELSCTSLPHMIHLKPGQSLEDFLRSTEHPNYAWFATVDLPKIVQKPSSGGATLGTSQVTAAGVQ